MDASNVTVAELQPRTVSVSEPAQVPLALVTVQPAQGAQRVDTKAQIALFFNQSIDASQLEVTVCEPPSIQLGSFRIPTAASF